MRRKRLLQAWHGSGTQRRHETRREAGQSELEGKRLLHFSPEKAIWPLLRDEPGYVSSDVQRHKRVSRMIDIREIAFPDAHFDYLICNHVLEHVVADGRAMAECFRVLKPGGRALFSVPIEPDRAETWNPPPEMDPAEVARLCGELHVRLYGRNSPDLLRGHGFAVAEIAISDADNARHRLRWPGVDQVFVATKPEVP